MMIPSANVSSVSTSELWRPLSARRSGNQQWHPRVSPALAAELRQWIILAGRDINSRDLDRVPVRLAIRLEWDPEKDGDDEFLEPLDHHDWVRYALANSVPDRGLPDVVDAFLDLLPVLGPGPNRADPLPIQMIAAMNAVKRDHRRDLQQHLDDARLIYRISEDGRRLVRRTEPASEIALTDASTAVDQMPASGSASDFLLSAWAALNGLHPDAPRAYSDAIKAVEAAAHSIVQPNHGTATLGSMLGEFRNAPHRFTASIGDPGTSAGVETAFAMMTVLWKGQTSRHGGQLPTRLETEAEARAAVHLATTLVAWFATGIVQRQP
ncbi:hypothetical protein Ait01nite_020600 [Actinoplanes italicus]|uniref:Abortive infection Abi-like protein n=1 Tax=Actinoplanes italicus TaxID=113567 RepID=A0A2T0KP75_9ACTN|nr:hypothetical protein [Actinoplanes italicus]PRX25542.1 hypothetical protein CLV67_101259 [Actinoplanes italicus]GIE29015.1 hypothetical protein Ait01nite_020600 [Actinoplanes italicus]